jgi:hypothetical protein
VFEEQIGNEAQLEDHEVDFLDASLREKSYAHCPIHSRESKCSRLQLTRRYHEIDRPIHVCDGGVA